MANFKPLRLAGLLLLLPAALAHAEPMRSLTLREVLDLAQENNPGVLAGEEGVRISTEYVKQARSALLPQVTGQVYQGRFRSMQDKGGPRMTPGTDNNFTAAFIADLSLIDARNIANFKTAKLDARAARYQQLAAVEDTCAAAAAAYFFYERSLSSLTVVEKSIELDEVLLSRARDRRAANVATDLDVTRAEAALAGDRRRLLSAKTDLQSARLSLLTLTGLDPSLEISISRVPPPEPDAAALPDWLSVLKTRPEYLAAQELLERDRVAAKAAAWQRFPSLSTQASYGNASHTAFDDEGGTTWGVSATMTMPLFDSGSISSQKKQAYHLIRQQEHLIREIEAKIHSAYNLAVDSLSRRWEELPLARENVRLAELELAYARDRFDAGVSDNSDVVTAQLSLASARDALVDAEYRYQLARIDLARVLGSVQSRLSE